MIVSLLNENQLKNSPKVLLGSGRDKSRTVQKVQNKTVRINSERISCMSSFFVQCLKPTSVFLFLNHVMLMMLREKVSLTKIVQMAANCDFLFQILIFIIKLHLS